MYIENPERYEVLKKAILTHFYNFDFRYDFYKSVKRICFKFGSWVNY